MTRNSKAHAASSVTEATRRATEAAIAYEEAGSHELKGKSEPVALSQALRVIALVGGELEDHPMRKDYVQPDDFEWEPTPHDDVLARAKQHYAPRPAENELKPS